MTRTLTLFPLLLTGLFVAGCDTEDGEVTDDTGVEADTDTDTDADTDTDTDTDTDVQGDTFVRVAHLSPDAPAVDVYVDGIDDPVVSDLAFREGTGYLTVPGGEYTFRVTAAGGSPDDAVLVIEDIALDEGVSYTAAATNYVADISAIALVDDADGIEDGNIRIQVLHGAPGVGQVDIWETSGPTLLLEDVDYGVSAVLPDLPAAAYNIGLDLDNDSVPDATFSVPDVGGGFVNLYATNDADGNPALVAHLSDGSVAVINPD